MNFRSTLKDIWYFLKALVSRGGCSILMYHSVSDKDGFFTVRPAEFEWQMAYLKGNGFKIISLAELVVALINRQNISSKTVVLTFDDGYLDNYTNVFPVLKKYGFSTTIFLSTNFIGSEREIKSEKIFLKLMNWEQIVEMHQSGLIDFQPHTLSHPKLANIAVEEVKKEILESREIIEKKLGKNCLIFSYPYGNYNQSTINILKNDGFSAAVTVESGRIRKLKGGNDIFELPRNSVDAGTTKVQFIGKVR